MKFDIGIFFENLLRKFKFLSSRARITGTLQKDTFFIIFRSFLFRMRNVSDKSCRGKRNTHFMFSNFFFFENYAVCEIMWKNIAEPARCGWKYGTCASHVGYLRLQTHTLAEYAVVIAFPLHQQLHERALILRYTYIASLVFHIHIRCRFLFVPVVYYDFIA